ncbi:helix-turn-helix transcriptional regulator [Streptomyces clavifer]|uniref:helix-turn-helix transcriptional regulator n=1 Tax=Streptomyces clavifer TaxID=68188 RepID=UPI0033AE0405
MATFLYRLGQSAFRRRRTVVLLRLAVLAAVGAAAATAPAATDDGSFMPGIEAQKAFDLMEQRFPGSDSDGADARIVFVAPDGRKVTGADSRAAVVLLSGIRTVAAGESLLSPTATRALITRLLATPEPDSRLVPPERLNALTTREREVMALAAHGRSNTEIAEELVVSPLTVRSHVRRAMAELDAHDRAQLVVIAYQSGLVRTPPPGRPS